MTIALILALTYDAFLAAACTYALVRGGRPERVGAMINLVASIASSVMRMSHLASWEPAGIIIMAIDAGVVLGFYLLATRTDRFWPIWAFGFSLADICISLAGALLPRVPILAYQTGLGVYAYLALIALAKGTSAVPRNAQPTRRLGIRPSSCPPHIPPKS